MRIEGARAPERAKAPDVSEQLLLLENALRIPGERTRSSYSLVEGCTASPPTVTVREARSISTSRTVKRRCRGPFERRRTAHIRASTSS
jgi:hypothetical protein